MRLFKQPMPPVLRADVPYLREHGATMMLVGYSTTPGEHWGTVTTVYFLRDDLREVAHYSPDLRPITGLVPGNLRQWGQHMVDEYHQRDIRNELKD